MRVETGCLSTAIPGIVAEPDEIEAWQSLWISLFLITLSPVLDTGVRVKSLD
jgi:hypothetical protein